MSAKQIVIVREQLVSVRETNRSAGHSYGSTTAEMWFEAEYSDGSKELEPYLFDSWKPFLEKKQNDQ